MSNPLQKDLRELVEANVITSDIAEKISHYYQSKKDTTPNSFAAVLGILGSLLVGSGIVLLIAHNWADIGKPLQTILAFLPLAIGQAICLFTLLKRKGNRVWQESSAAFLFFAVGAAVALISQIYHIGGSLSNFLFTWLVLTIALVYIMPSTLVALLFIAVNTWFCCLDGRSAVYFLNFTANNWWYLGLMLLPISFSRLLL